MNQWKTINRGFKDGCTTLHLRTRTSSRQQNKLLVLSREICLHNNKLRPASVELDDLRKKPNVCTVQVCAYIVFLLFFTELENAFRFSVLVPVMPSTCTGKTNKQNKWFLIWKTSRNSFHMVRRKPLLSLKTTEALGLAGAVDGFNRQTYLKLHQMCELFSL